MLFNNKTWLSLTVYFIDELVSILSLVQVSRPYLIPSQSYALKMNLFYVPIGKIQRSEAWIEKMKEKNDQWR